MLFLKLIKYLSTSLLIFQTNSERLLILFVSNLFTYLPIKVVLQLLVKCGDTLAKTCKFWNDQVIAKYLDQKGQISRQNKLELIQIQIKGLQADILFWSVFAHVFNHFFQPFIRCWFDTSSPNFLKKRCFVTKIALSYCEKKLF